VSTSAASSSAAGSRIAAAKREYGLANERINPFEDVFNPGIVPRALDAIVLRKELVFARK
jgi:hypothetical protein